MRTRTGVLATGTFLFACGTSACRDSAPDSAQERPSDTRPRYVGEVRWFNPAESAGFVTSLPHEEASIHHSAVRVESATPLMDGTCVEFTMAEGPTGPTADDIVVLDGCPEIPAGWGRVKTAKDSPSCGPPSASDADLEPDDQLAQRVRDLIVEELGIERSCVTDDASFVEDLGADSLDAVELVMAFEELFGVDIPDDDAIAIHTVGQAIVYLQEKGAGMHP